MDVAREELLASKMVEDVAVIGFNRGGIREEREILTTLDSLGRYMESKSGLKILLDLGNIEYISSAGLGHLVGLLKKSRAHGSLFKLCCPRAAIQELFKVMRLDEVLEIHPDVKTALESFKSVKAPNPAT